MLPHRATDQGPTVSSMTNVVFDFSKSTKGTEIVAMKAPSQLKARFLQHVQLLPQSSSFETYFIVCLSAFFLNLWTCGQRLAVPLCIRLISHSNRLLAVAWQLSKSPTQVTSVRMFYQEKCCRFSLQFESKKIGLPDHISIPGSLFKHKGDEINLMT